MSLLCRSFNCCVRTECTKEEKFGDGAVGNKSSKFKNSSHGFMSQKTPHYHIIILYSYSIKYGFQDEKL